MKWHIRFAGMGVLFLLTVALANSQGKKNFKTVDLLTGPGGSPASDTDVPALDEDERLVESAGLSSEGPSLLELLRTRARNEIEPGRIDDLVRRLSGKSYEERIKAGADL